MKKEDLKFDIRDKVKIKYGKFIDLPTRGGGGINAYACIKPGAIGVVHCISSGGNEITQITISFPISEAVDIRVEFCHPDANHFTKVE